MQMILLGIGGSIGAALRYSISLLLLTNDTAGFPFATVAVNLAGCFLLGMLSSGFELKITANPDYLSALKTGLIGSFTTFSTFSVEVMQLLQNQSYFFAILYRLLRFSSCCVWHEDRKKPIGKEKSSMMNFMLVAVGGFFGAILRAVISKRLNHPYRFFYIGTFSVNLLGSFALGFLVNMHLHTTSNLILSIGFLGAFTTFSTFKLESLTLIHAKQWKEFVLYSILTYTIGIAFAFAGFWMAILFLA